MKELFIQWMLNILESILQDLVDDGKLNGSTKNEILRKISE